DGKGLRRLAVEGAGMAGSVKGGGLHRRADNSSAISAGSKRADYRAIGRADNRAVQGIGGTGRSRPVEHELRDVTGRQLIEEPADPDANHGAPIPRNIPGQTDARSKVIVVLCNQLVEVSGAERLAVPGSIGWTKGHS